ncbi:NLR family CARD domain-containing protein 4-like [Patiria miniata]|uniref:NACHT domain-containing protein n=1 Tax=Patiria miniata TaxID=46514 RepID=A0A913ZFZ3_PATMI|nr:NLR family CARD domain-containing protein 4-like [Patiria miniata]XP_038050710.1 NLR family CARD domain-containing protein 4-like [Patiria miniata]
MQQSEAAYQWPDVPTTMQQSAAASEETDVPTTMQRSEAAYQQTDVPTIMQQPEAAYQWTDDVPSMIEQSAAASQRTDDILPMMQQSAAAYQRTDDILPMMLQSAAAYQRTDDILPMMQQSAAAYQRTDDILPMMQQSAAAYQRTDDILPMMQQSAAAYQRTDDVPSMMQQSAAAYQWTDDIPSMIQQSAAAYQQTDVPSMIQQSAAAYQWTDDILPMMQQSAAAYQRTDDILPMMQQSAAAYQRIYTPTTMQQEAQVPAALDSPQRSGTIGNSVTISGSNNPIIAGSSGVNINYNFPLQGPGCSAPKKMKLDSPAQDPADCCEDALKSYYRRKGSFVKLIPWVGDDRKHIKKIYTELQLILGKDRVKLASYDDILQRETEEGDLILIAVLTGLAGRGKTTLFNKIAYDWAVGSSRVLRKYKLVFLLKMHALEQSSDLVDAVFDQLLAKDVSIERGTLDMFIKNSPGKVLVLLDGFDELMTTTLCDSSFGSILEILNGKKLRGCTVLVSTRPSHVDRLVSEKLVQDPFTHVEVMGFSWKNVTEYVNNFFVGEPDKAKGLLEKIKLSGLLIDLAASPMLLLVMCVLWQEKCTLPETMSRLYHDGFSYIFRRKGLDSQDEAAKVVIEIGKVALHGLLSPDQSLSFKESDFEPSVLELALKAGILTSQRVRKRLQSHNSVQFFHKTFQEFSAAAYLQSLLEADPEEFQKILNEIMSKGAKRFEYLLRFCCGDNEACTYEIMKVFQVRCQEDLSFESEMGQLALHCFFEGQSESLPPEEFIHSFITDNICIDGFNWDRDCLNSVIYFLKSVAEQTKNSGNTYLAKVKELFVLADKWTWFIEKLAVTMCAMTNLNAVVFSFCLYLTGSNMADIAKSFRDLTNLREFYIHCSDELRGTAALWCMHLKQLKSLKKLHLSACKLNGQDITLIAESLIDLPNFSELILFGNNLGGTVALWCMHLKQMRTLTKLNLSGCSLNLQDIKHVGESVRDLPNLVELKVSYHDPSGTAALRCMQLKQLKTLTKLGLCKCFVNGQDIKHVAESLPNLVELDLSDNELCGTATLWCIQLKQLKTLTKLGLRRCSLNGQDMKHIADSLRELPNLGELDLSQNYHLCGTAALWCMHLKQFKSLRKLDLGYCSLNGQDIEHVAESLRDLPNFSELDLSGINLGGTAALWCKHLKQLKSLTKVSLSECSLNGQDLKHVAESLRDLPNLVELVLLGNKLGGTAALWCMEVKQLLHLQRLNLRYCDLTEDDKNHIYESLSDLRKNGLDLDMRY